MAEVGARLVPPPLFGVFYNQYHSLDCCTVNCLNNKSGTQNKHKYEALLAFAHFLILPHYSISA